MLPSKILYSIRSKDLFSITGTEPDAIDALVEAISGLSPEASVVKKQTFKVRELYAAIRQISNKLERYAFNYELWLFSTGGRTQPLVESAVSSGRAAPKINLNSLSKDHKLWKKLDNAFTILFGKNGINLHDAFGPPNATTPPTVTITYSKIDLEDPEEVPYISNIKFQSSSRPATDLVWKYGEDPLGGFKQEEVISNDTTRNYMFLMEQIYRLERGSTKWMEFIETYRYPRIKILNDDGPNAVIGKGLGLLKDLSSEAFERVLVDLQESEFKFNLLAEKYNKQYPNKKAINQKIKQDLDLENFGEKVARGLLVDQSRVEAGDPLAEMIDGMIARGFEYQRASKDEDAKESAKILEQPPSKYILGQFGKNFHRFLMVLGISVVARAVPLERLQELNIREKLKLIDPIGILEKALEDAYTKVRTAVEDSEEVQKGINFIIKLVNGILNSPAFDPRLLAAFDDYLSENPPKDVSSTFFQGDPTTLRGKMEAALKALTEKEATAEGTTPPADVPIPAFTPETVNNTKDALNENGGDLSDREEVSSESSKIMCNGSVDPSVNPGVSGIFWYVRDQASVNTPRGFNNRFENSTGCPIGATRIPDGSPEYQLYSQQELQTVSFTPPPASETPATQRDPVEDQIGSIYLGFGLLDFIKSGNAEINIDLVSRNLEGEVIGRLELDQLPNTLVSKYDEITSDLDILKESYSNCEEPPPEIYEKYKKYGEAIKEFFDRDKPKKTKLEKKKAKKKKLRDLKAVLKLLFTAYIINLYYVAVTAMIKLAYQLIRQLSLNLSCAQFSVLLSKGFDGNTFTPRNPSAGSGLEPKNGNGIISAVADAMNALNPMAPKLDEDVIIAALADISSVVGFYDASGNPEDISQLEEFFFQVSSLLTVREQCDLFSGVPSVDTMTIVKNLISLRFSSLPMSKEEEDIKKLFSAMGSLTGKICYEANSPGYIDATTMPVNSVLCTKPSDYEEYVATRTYLLEYKNVDGGVSNEEINEQIDLLCRISRSTIEELVRQFLSDNPFASYYDQLDDPLTLCGRGEVVPGSIATLTEQVNPIYENIVSSLEMIFMEETVGGNGLLNNILSNKAGMAYPGYLALESIFSGVPNVANPFPIIEVNSKYLATWMRENMAVLGSAEAARITSLPLMVNTTDIGLISNVELEAYRVVLNIDPKKPSTFPSYRQLFEIVGNPKNALRTISFVAPENKRKNIEVSSFALDPSNRIYSSNFFIIPHNGTLNKNYSSLTTTIVDYNPFSVSLNTTCSIPQPPLPLQIAPVQVDAGMNNLLKKYDIMNIVKDEKDYRISIYENPSLLVPTINTQDKTQVSNQAIIFSDLIFNSLKNSGKDIGTLSEQFTQYLNKDYYNFVFNSFLDGIIKIPSLNEKNLSYGFTDRKINLLNSTHVNTLTGAPAPVKPEFFEGTENLPAAYFYNALQDTVINFYNLLINDADSRFAPIKRNIPDLASLVEKMSSLYVYLPEDDREATDLSNQMPFDMIIPRSSFATSQGLIEASMMVFSYEMYVKGFSLFNTMEPNECNYDHTLYRFLANKYKEVIKSSCPTKLASAREGFEDTGLSDKETFYYQFLELFINGILKRRDNNTIELTERQASILEQIERKMNIWELGVPSTNLTIQEDKYFAAASEIGKLEITNYPTGPMNKSMSAGVMGPALGALQNRSDEIRKLQVRRRNYYWSLLLQDTESLCLDMIGTFLKEKFIEISYKMQILNSKFTRLNDSLYIPFVGGPSVQANELNIENNIFPISPTYLASKGRIPETFASFGSEEDYNFNGFILLDPNIDENIINDGAKEVVMSIEAPVFSTQNPQDLVDPRYIPRHNATARAAREFASRDAKVRSNLLNEELAIAYNGTLLVDPYAGQPSSFEQSFKKYDSESGPSRLVYTQNRIPFVVEQYARLEPFADLTNLENQDIISILYEYLYSDYNGELVKTFKGVVSLKNLVLFLLELGFFEDTRIDSKRLKTISFSSLFKTCKIGLRLTCVLPEAGNIVRQNFGLSSIIGTLTDAEIETLRNNEKLFFEETGYPISLFSNEIDLSNLVTPKELSKMVQDPSYYNAFFRSNNLKNINAIVQSDTYKLMFDYAIPLRYFNSLSAIYTLKSFGVSLGTYYDTEGKLFNLSNNSGFKMVEKDTAYPEYHSSLATFIDECYHSYNLMNNFGDNLPLELEPTLNRKSHILKTIKSKPKEACDIDVTKAEQDLKQNLLSFNDLSPEDKTKLFNDINSGTPPEFSNYAFVIKDPTNECGFAEYGCKPE
jgi:hypothetical protein